MNANEKRQLENELTVMGLPGLDDPNLVQTMADIVSGYPMPSERVDFFCDLLNECEGARRREMYEAMRPRLSFDVPSLDVCEARIAAKAERIIRPKGLPTESKDDGVVEKTIVLQCRGCGKIEEFAEVTTAGAMMLAKKTGWGRGPLPGKEYCAECRLAAMLPSNVGATLTRRFVNA